ncbi:MAG: hypothetical protein ACTSPA_14005 [Promethearchaeota archaeon]
MKKIYWFLVGLGIVGSFVSIFFIPEHPVVMVFFFGFYLLVIFALFTYYFENIKVKKIIPELLNKRSINA